jgi:hypothetical protein
LVSTTTFGINVFQSYFGEPRLRGGEYQIDDLAVVAELEALRPKPLPKKSTRPESALSLTWGTSPCRRPEKQL